MPQKVPHEEKLNAQDIWKLFRETDRQIKESDRILTKKLQETERILTEKFQETDRQFKETDRQFKETDRQFKETDRQFKESDRKLRQLETLFTGQWGKLMEALVEPGVLQVFKNRGIAVNQIYQRMKSTIDGKQMEIDLLLGNGNICVVIEVKTTLKIEDVNDLLERIKEFPIFFPPYKDKVIYGAVAGLSIEEASDKYAYRKGLFVLNIGKDDMITLKNDEKFQPVNFNDFTQ